MVVVQNDVVFVAIILQYKFLKREVRCCAFQYKFY